MQTALRNWQLAVPGLPCSSLRWRSCYCLFNTELCTICHRHIVSIWLQVPENMFAALLLPVNVQLNMVKILTLCGVLCCRMAQGVWMISKLLNRRRKSERLKTTVSSARIWGFDWKYKTQLKKQQQSYLTLWLHWTAFFNTWHMYNTFTVLTQHWQQITLPFR